MNLPKVHSKIFWPSHCRNSPSGYVVGWNIRSFIVCVVTVVSGVEYAELEHILNKFAHSDNSNISISNNITSKNASSNSSNNNTLANKNTNTTHNQVGAPKILGLWIAKSDTSPNPWHIQVPDVHDVDIWVTLEQDRFQYPQIREICCYGYRYQNGSRWTSSQIIFYTPPKNYFYSMHQLEFDSKSTTCNCTVPATELEATLRQINCSREIEHTLLSMIATTKHRGKNNGPKESSSASINDVVSMHQEEEEEGAGSSSSTTLRRRTRVPISRGEGTDIGTSMYLADDHQITSRSDTPRGADSRLLGALDYLLGGSYQLLLVVVFCLRICCTLIFYIFERTRLQQRTYTGRQLCHCLAVLREYPPPFRFRNFPFFFFLSRGGRNSPPSSTPSSFVHSPLPPTTSTTPINPSTPNIHLSPNYNTSVYNTCTWPGLLRKWNSRWLAVNDILMGVTAGYFLYRHSTWVLTGLAAGQQGLTDTVLRSLIEWLMGWPAGFKLNENLDRFLGRLFLYYIDKWAIVTEALFSYVGATVIQLVAWSGVFGISVMISIVLDLANFLTVHITCFYYISARFHHLELVVLSSLWKLFRGMKYNPLKHRIDSSDYEFDQLLLGTILLTLLVFLFPTTAVYYIFFTSLRLVLICFQGLGALALELLNYFPLYHLVIYFTHPELMPSGIRFVVDNSTVESSKRNAENSSFKWGNKNSSMPTQDAKTEHYNKDSTNVSVGGRRASISNVDLTEDFQLLRNIDKNNGIVHNRSKGALWSSSDSFPPLIEAHMQTSANVVAINTPCVSPPSASTSLASTSFHPTTTSNDCSTTNEPPDYCTTIYLRLESQPELIGTLFFHLLQFVSDVLKTYTFPKLVKGFLTGAPWSQFQN